MSFKIFIKVSFLFLTVFLLVLVWGCYATKNAAPKLIKDSLVFIYPSEAREKHLEGTVVLRILIDEEGFVSEKEIHKSSGYDILDQTALKVAETARFKPALVEGQKISVRMTWPLVFEITSLTFNPEGWVEKTQFFHHEISSENPSVQQIAQQGLYYHYKDFSSHMVKYRKLFLNESVLEVVLPEIREKWLDFYDSWPLTFILFQDYITRYPDSEFREEGEAYLIEYIKNEMFQLKIRTKIGTIYTRGRNLYQELLLFLQQNHPGSVTDDLLNNIPKG